MAGNSGTSDELPPETRKRLLKACPLCGHVPGTTVTDLQDGFKTVVCATVCGRFRIHSVLCEDFQLSRLGKSDLQLKRNLSRHARYISDKGEQADFTEDNWRELADEQKAVSVEDKEVMLLILLARRAGSHSRHVAVNTFADGHLVCEPDPRQFVPLLNELTRIGDLDPELVAGFDDQPRKYAVTPQGWKRVEAELAHGEPREKAPRSKETKEARAEGTSCRTGNIGFVPEPHRER